MSILISCGLISITFSEAVSQICVNNTIDRILQRVNSTFYKSHCMTFNTMAEISVAEY